MTRLIVFILFMMTSSYGEGLSGCFDAFERIRLQGAFPQERASIFVDNRLRADEDIIIDIGGEGRYAGAININPQPHLSEHGRSHEFIPNWVEGVGSELPFKSKSVDRIYVESTPVSLETAQEIERVLKSGGQGSFLHPQDYSEQVYKQLLQVYQPSQIHRSIEGNMTRITLSN